MALELQPRSDLPAHLKDSNTHFYVFSPSGKKFSVINLQKLMQGTSSAWGLVGWEAMERYPDGSLSYEPLRSATWEDLEKLLETL